MSRGSSLRLMTKSNAACIVLTLGALCASVLAQRPDSGRNRDGYVSIPGRGYRFIPCVPVPISAIELDHWTWFLRLSAEQRREFDRIHQGYLEKEESVHFKHIQPLWDETAGMTEAGPMAGSLAVAEQYSNLITVKRQAAVLHLTALENSFFAEVTPFLAPEQVEKLEVVRVMRERAHAKDPPEIPGAEVDVGLLLFSLHEREFDLTSSNPGEMSETMDSYHYAVQHLIRARCKALCRAAGEGTVLFTLQISGRGLGNEVNQKRKALHREVVEVEDNLNDLNESTITALQGLLPAKTGQELRRIYDAIAYPAVYPDPTDVKEIVDELVQIGARKSDKADSVEELIIYFEARRSEICTKMKERFLDWRKSFAIERNNSSDVIGRYKQEMMTLNEDRYANARAAVASISSVLGTEDNEKAKEILARFENRLRAYEFVPDARFPN